MNPPQNEKRTLGRYTLSLELATGGMGTVFLAHSKTTLGFSKLVAIKTIHPHLQKEEGFVEMLIDEARISSQISHPNVCQVFDFGIADGTYFMAMEFLLGESVRQLVKAASGDPELAQSAEYIEASARIIADAAAGLHAAHELKDEHGQPLHIVHRDISPQNIFVTYDGAVKVLDFGVARARNRLTSTQADTLKGKYPYMSPEQLKRLELDRRADVWALGVVLWELLTARPLFRRADRIDTMLAVAEDPIPLPSSLVKGVPQELDAIVMSVLERDRDRRLPSAQALSEALEQWLLERRKVVTMASVATLMTRSFGERKASRRVQIDQAKQAHQTPDPRGDSPSIEKTVSKGTVVSGPASEDSLGPQARSTRSPPYRWVFGAAAVLVLIGGASLVVYATVLRPPEAPGQDSGQREPTGQEGPELAVTAPPVGGRDAAPDRDAHDAEVDAGVDSGDRAVQPQIRPPVRPSMNDRVGAPGRLSISVRGPSYASVTVAGRRMDVPGVLNDLPSGRHRVVAVSPDGQRLVRRVTIEPGGRHQLVLNFDR